VIEDARDYGLVLGDNGVLYDSKKDQTLPPGVAPMPLLSDVQLADHPEVPVGDVVRDYVARYRDLMALASDRPAKVIGGDALLQDRPGFEVDFLTRGSIDDQTYSTDRHEILMIVRGHWRLTWEGGETTLAPGDTCAVPPGLNHALSPSMTGEASLYRVRNTDDPSGLTWKP
jgi:mannose-6-phosphate isomerase-like protein (cupin superfamily)